MKWINEEGSIGIKSHYNYIVEFFQEINFSQNATDPEKEPDPDVSVDSISQPDKIVRIPPRYLAPQRLFFVLVRTARERYPLDWSIVYKVST